MFELEKFNESIAVILEDSEEIKYSQLNQYANSLYHSIAKRCLVLNICTNTLGSLVGYLSFLNNGVVPLMVSSDLDKDLLQNFIDIYKPDFLYLPDSMADNFSKYFKTFSILEYSLLKTEYNNEYILHNDLALLLTTSGSTGSPKLVRQSYKNIKSNTESIIEYLKIDSFEKAITTLPMHYTYGISIINTHLYVGATLILTDKSVMQKEFWELLNKHESTSFGGVPYTYEMLDRIRFMRMNIASLKTMTQAGGKLSPNLHLKFAQFAKDNNKEFIVMYGQTEATARMSYLPFEKSIEKYGSMGIAIPGGSFSLIDNQENKIVTSNTVGELMYSGDNVTLGYAENGYDLALGNEFKGTLITGDMAKFDSDGYFYVVGRKKRFLKIFGNRVNLDEIEQLIKHQFGNLDCACIGIDNNLIICLTTEIAKSEIIDFISNKTALNKVAFKVKILDELPKNESGKTIYKELEKLYVNVD